MKRIVIAEPEDYPTEALALLREVGEVVLGEFDRKRLLHAVEQASALVVRFSHHIDAEVIAAAPRLVAVASASTGTDHIDTNSCRNRAIAVISLHGETEFLRSIPSTAELTFGLIVMLARNMLGAALSTRRGEWDRNRYRGRNLAGQRLGLIGCGRVGEMVAGYAEALQMRVVAFDPFRSELPEGVARAGTLHELLAQCDIVSIHVPLNAATTNMISSAELSALPPGACIINTARGAIIDEQALCAALSSGHLSGAAIDVVATEPRVGETLTGPLAAYAREHDNLILTPHIGGATFDSMSRAETFVARKLVAHLRQNS